MATTREDPKATRDWSKADAEKPKAQKQAPIRQTTRYLVLRKVHHVDSSSATHQGHTWEALGEIESVNDVRAIGDMADREHIENGTFVAVPARSFRERTIKVETVTKRHVG